MRIALLTICITLLLGCKNENAKRIAELNMQAITLNDTYRGQKLWYPGDLNAGGPPSKKVVVYYDATCSVCFEQLMLWKREMEEWHALDPNIQFRFVLSTDDSIITRKNLEQVNFPLTYVQLDVKKEFVRHYPFAEDKGFNALLIDATQKIEFVGSPLVSKKIKEVYLDALHR